MSQANPSTARTPRSNRTSDDENNWRKVSDTLRQIETCDFASDRSEVKSYLHSTETDPAHAHRGPVRPQARGALARMLRFRFGPFRGEVLPGEGRRGQSPFVPLSASVRVRPSVVPPQAGLTRSEPAPARKQENRKYFTEVPHASCSPVFGTARGGSSRLLFSCSRLDHARRGPARK